MTRKLFKRTAAALLAGLLVLPLAQTSWAQEAAGMEETEEAASTPEALAADVEIVRANDETITVQELTMRANFRPAPGQLRNVAEEIPRMRGDQLVELTKHVFAFDMIAGEHGGEVELEEEMKGQIDDAVMRYAESILARQVLEDQATEPTEEELRELYEENKDSLFKLQEELRMRHIFVSTYVPYEVKEGDTLESIAEEVSGDREMADKILTDEKEKRPRHEKLAASEDGEEIELDARALVAGEKLLVPAAEDSEIVAQAREKIQAAYEALENGGKFTEVSEEYSENETPGRVWVIRPAQQERAIMEEILGTFMSLEDEEYSEPVRTKHGFQIVRRESYQPEETQAFEDVRPRLATMYQRQQRQQLVNDFFASVINDEKMTQFNEENLAKSGDDAAEGDVVLTIGEQEITRADLRTYLRIPSEEALPPIDELKAKMAEAVPLQRPLVVAKIEQGGLLESDQVREARQIVEDTVLAQQWISKHVEEEVSQVADAEIQKFYDENINRFEVPEAFALYAIVEKSGDEEAAIAVLEGKIEGVESLVDFQEAATGMNRDFDRRFRGDKGNLGKQNATAFNEAELEVIRAVSAPGLSKPFYREGEAIVYWVEEVQEGRTQPVEEVRETIEEELLRQKRFAAAQEVLDNYKEQVEVEVLVD